MKTPFQKEERSHLHNSLPSQGHTCLIRDRIEQHEKRKETESNVSHFFFFEEFARKIADSGVVKKCTYHTIPFMTLDYSSEMQKFYLFFFSRLYEVCCCTTLSKILNNVQDVPTSLGYAKCSVLKLRKVCEQSELCLQKVAMRRGKLLN